MIHTETFRDVSHKRPPFLISMIGPPEDGLLFFTITVLHDFAMINSPKMLKNNETESDM
jgi:hypothetical protein